MKFTLFLLAFAFLLLSGPIVIPVYAKETPVTITLTRDGFAPKDLSIPKGTTVLFKSTLGRYFWPASNDHPDHRVFAEFDPKKPIAPDQSWSYTFEKQGDWGFHDHISPYFSGIIRVTDSNSTVKKSDEAKHTVGSVIKTVRIFLINLFTQNSVRDEEMKCKIKTLNRSDRIQCWEKIVLRIIHKEGLKRALSYIEKQKNTDTAFAADCHIYAHRVGEEYYWQYIRSRNAQTSEKFGMCDMGFFHGFMQEFASHENNASYAKTYCDKVEKQMQKNGSYKQILEQCYHGMGHGFTYLYAPVFWGNMKEVLKRGIDDCLGLVPESRECINGVYGGAAAMYWGLHGFLLEYDDAHPFGICDSEPAKYKPGCYDQMTPVVYSQFSFDFKKTASEIMNISHKESALIAMGHLGGMPAITLVPKGDDLTSIVRECRALPDIFAKKCLYGLSASLVRIGSLEQGMNRSEQFCLSDYLTEEESALCLESVGVQLTYTYGTAQHEKFCNIIQSRRKNFQCMNYE